MRHIVCSMVLLISLSACAPLSPSAGDDHVAQLNRLARLTFPLAVAATESCPFETELTYGFVLGAPPASNGLMDTSLPLHLQFVHSGLPSGSVDIQIGDHVLAVNEISTNGMTVEAAQDVITRYSRARIQPLTLLVAREGEPREVNLWGVPACRFTVHLMDSQSVNALADGNRIFVTTGMLSFVGSDEELAWVLAHELAHNVLGHPQQTMLQGILNSFVFATTGETGREIGRPELEIQADALASIIVARAGYDVRRARLFLRRLVFAEGQSIPRPALNVSHPTTSARIAAFDKTLADIKEQIREGVISPVKMRSEVDETMAGQAFQP